MNCRLKWSSDRSPCCPQCDEASAIRMILCTFSTPVPRGRPSTPTARFIRNFSPRVHDRILLDPPPNAPATHEAHCTAKCASRPAVSSFGAILPFTHSQTTPRSIRLPPNTVVVHPARARAGFRRCKEPPGRDLVHVFASSIFTGWQGLKCDFPVA